MKSLVNRWDRVIAALRELDDTVVQVGWFDEKTATIAYINDRGSADGVLPARPVLGPGMDLARDDITRAQARAVRDALTGHGSSRDSAERVGAAAEQGVRDAIEQVLPPNAKSTIAQKHGYSAPLRGFSPDRIWTQLEHRVVSVADAANDDAVE